MKGLQPRVTAAPLMVALATVVEAPVPLCGGSNDPGPRGVGKKDAAKAEARVAGVRTIAEASRLGHNIADAHLFWAGTIQFNYSKTISPATER